jgi:HEAT repeat protein
MREDDGLKAALSAVILTSMGSVYEELTPILTDALQSQDPVLRSYVAAAYGLINPQDTTHVFDVVRLYIFDNAFAQRALNLMTPTDKEQLSLLKKASTTSDPQLRAAAIAWLGSLHTPQALDQLLKRAKKETDSSVQTQLATALAANPDLALADTLKGLNISYKKPASATYALALGFMTGNSVSALKDILLSGKENQRINALRACAYMAGVLSNPDAFSYSSDRVFDTHLLKGLIPQISALANNGSDNDKIYAQNALTQIEKLM